MSYEPRPDSVAFRALAHMELLHKGSEITSGVLASALGVDANSMAAQLAACVERGLIFRRQKGGHLRSPVFWSLVDHSGKTNGSVAPLPPQVVEQLSKPARDAIANGASVEEAVAPALTLRQEIAKQGRVARAHKPAMTLRECMQAEEKGADAPEIRIALWSDGTLEIRRTPDDLVLFTADEARAIVDYLVAVEA